MDIFLMAGIFFTEGMLSLSYHKGISLCFLNSETKEQNPTMQIHPCFALSYQLSSSWKVGLNGRHPYQNCPQGVPGDNNHENWFPLPNFYIGCLPSKNTRGLCASKEISTTRPCLSIIEMGDLCCLAGESERKFKKSRYLLLISDFLECQSKRETKKSRKRKNLGACTQANQDGSHPFLYAQSAGFSALRYCFHNGSCTFCRIGGLEDATAHEDTINPQLHAQGGIGWSGHAASGEVNHGKLAWNLPQWTTSTSKH